MIDREKVLKGIKMCISPDVCSPNNCPYYDCPDNESGLCWERLMGDTLTLLKEQEVKMSVCDKCGLEHPADDRYCPRCGKSNFD